MLLEVKVIPNSKGFGISYKGGWIVRVKSPPEKGKANAELEKRLSEALCCEVRVARGNASRKKALEVGLSERELDLRLRAHAGKNR